MAGVSSVLCTQNPVSSLSGIFASGYGLFPQFVANDASLAPEARLIYAYYCLLANGMSQKPGEWTAAPYESRILQAVSMSHATFSKHRAALIERGLLETSQKLSDDKRHSFSVGYFRLNSAVPEAGGSKSNYGLCPRSVFNDYGLSRNAKAVYMILCSFACSSTSQDRSIENMTLGNLSRIIMPIRRLRSSLQELTDSGYLRMKHIPGHAPIFVLYNEKRNRDEGGLGQNYTTQSNTAQIKTTQTQTAQSCTLQLITKKTITKSHNTNPSILSSGCRDRQPVNESGKEGKTETRKITHKQEVSFLEKDLFVLAAEQIEADILEAEYGLSTIDAVVQTIAGVYATKAGSIVIQGRTLDIGHVQAVMRKIRARHVEMVLCNIGSQFAVDIKNTSSYLLSCLYSIVADAGIQDLKEKMRPLC